MSWTFQRRSLAVWLLCSALACGGRCSTAEEPAQAASLPAGQLQITVTDQNGQPLALVSVIVQQQDKTIANVRTTASGSAPVRQLAPGSYKVLVEKQGFYTTVVAKLEIVSGQQSPMEVKLQPVREYREE